MSIFYGFLKKGVHVLKRPQAIRSIRRGDNIVTWPFRRVLAEVKFERSKTNQIQFVKFLAQVPSTEVEKTRDEIDHLNFGFNPKFRSALYMLIRILKPEVVIETGVAAGASSLLMLLAMERNMKGELYSIDLPSPQQTLSDGTFYPAHEAGTVVPSQLRKRWHLILGDAREELPKLLAQLEGIDIFLHDSLHTESHMLWEYRTAWPFITECGVLLSDDIGTAFLKFCKEVECPFRCFDVEGIKKFGGIVK